jgi:hypothetical protein
MEDEAIVGASVTTDCLQVREGDESRMQEIR